jgi:hypothetical protein
MMAFMERSYAKAKKISDHLGLARVGRQDRPHREAADSAMGGPVICREG